MRGATDTHIHFWIGQRKRSNWPHPSVPPGTLDDLKLIEFLEDRAPREADRRRILADNPAQLYGF